MKKTLSALLIHFLSIAFATVLIFPLFYALLGKHRTVAPLEIKLEEYRKSAEQATGLTP